MKPAIILAAVVLCGCTKYVPVEMKLDKPKAPLACKGELDVVEDMQPFNEGAIHPTPVAINAAWAKHDLKRRAVDKRNARKWNICKIWIKHREDHP